MLLRALVRWALLDEKFLLASGVAAAGHLSTADVEDDETYDILGGSAGTILALLGLYDRTGADEALDDARIAYEATPTDWLNPQDVLCCGNFGRVGFLLEAGHRFDGGRGPAQELLARKADCGHFVIPDHGSDLVSPTFFQGCAGLAYTLVRVAESGSLPRLLLWE